MFGLGRRAAEEEPQWIQNNLAGREEIRAALRRSPRGFVRVVLVDSDSGDSRYVSVNREPIVGELVATPLGKEVPA
jgi:hypothetical protein